MLLLLLAFRGRLLVLLPFADETVIRDVSPEDVLVTLKNILL